MGVDLRIYPQNGVSTYFSRDSIMLGRDYQLHDLIKLVESKHGREVPRNGIGVFDKRFVETEYGEVIKGVPAGKLKEAVNGYETESWKNRAFLAYLKELPDELEIWLYWC